MKKKTSSSFLTLIVKLSTVVWIISIIAFVIVIGFGTKWFTGTIQDTQFGNSSSFLVFLVGSMGIGSLAFGLLVLVVIIKLVLSNKLITFEKSFKGIVLFTFKFIFLISVLPLILLWRIFRKPKIKVLEKLARAAIVIIALLSIWAGGYWAVGSLVAYQLGYITESIPVAGTGSMYPTFPKGETKTLQEQSKEVVGTPGMIRYPNGLVLFGQRIFGHKLGHGDIVVVENEKIRELTKQLFGEETGWVKRIVALEGDELEIRDGIFYLNGESQKEQYIAKPRSTFGETFLKECTKVKVPDNHIFVMGDNRKGSGDSREVGFIEESDVSYVLPFGKQKGNLDKNWRDTSEDLDESAKIRLNTEEYLELLNAKRKEAGVKPLKYQSKLENSAFKRGEVILKYDDFSYEATRSGYTQLKAMNDAGYSNITYGEAPTLGYYEARELLDNQFEFPDTKEFLLNKDYQELGIAEAEGNLNGCPSQVIVQHFAGYVPANYDKEVIDSWRASVDNLNSIIPSWEDAKGKGWVNEEELSRLLDILYQERTIVSRVLAKMEAKQWLTKEDDNLINEYNRMIQESSTLANKLNSQ